MQDKTIEPIWKENYSAIAMSSSEEYLPYLCVCLQSLVDNTDKKHNYDIVIFSSCENEEKKKIVTSKYSKKNISIRFYNPKRHFENIKLYISKPRFNEACYYRIITPEAMPSYKKVVFTDTDLIFNTDVQELYKINVNGHAIAACIDPTWLLLISREQKINSTTYKEYGKKVLNLKDISLYYNTGVAIINIQEFKKNDYCQKLKKLISENEYLSQEQCAMNSLFNTNIKKLDWRWNLTVPMPKQRLYPEDYNLKTAKIYHWPGNCKPWNYKKRGFSNKWWKHAKKTPFYDSFKIYKSNLIKKLTVILTA
ncbi:MAG: hypothetical protein E7Z88_05005 [Cyanobacteria bacterium SIG27]|nr:hypothetical protein [Cyanobacteria bacterium SIG27]